MPIQQQTPIMSVGQQQGSGKGPNLLSFIIAAATQNWPAAATALTGSPAAGMAVGGLQGAMSSAGAPGGEMAKDNTQANPGGGMGANEKTGQQASPELEKKQDPSGQGLNPIGQPQQPQPPPMGPAALAALSQSTVPGGGAPQAPNPFGAGYPLPPNFVMGSGFTPQLPTWSWWNRR